MVDKLSAEMLGAQLGNAAARIAVGMTGPDPAAEFHQAALAWKRSAENWKSRAIREQERKEKALDEAAYQDLRAESFRAALRDLIEEGRLERDQVNAIIKRHMDSREAADPELAERAARARQVG